MVVLDRYADRHGSFCRRLSQKASCTAQSQALTARKSRPSTTSRGSPALAEGSPTPWPRWGHIKDSWDVICSHKGGTARRACWKGRFTVHSMKYT
jgi:hypothetical protein